ncbi:MAG: TMEM175 family protein [Lachnospiraceae bacterium]
MPRNRMEAFSDGVLAIIITIMVLELELPKAMTWEAVREVLHLFIAYVLSYFYIGIYWTNHHHLVSTIKSASGKILWSNLHWLFWMSLIPIATKWIGQEPFHKISTFFYGFILLMCALTYHLLQTSIIKSDGVNSSLAKMIGKDRKGMLSILSSVVAMLIALILPAIAYLIFLAAILLWIVPDIRIEKGISPGTRSDRHSDS